MNTKLLIGREYPDSIIEAVRQAQNSIAILMYDWRWYSRQPAARIQKLNHEIVLAIRRGVGVRAVLNNSSIVQTLKSQGIDARCLNSKRVMHIKLVIIDQKILFIGSHNLSINAFELNHEMSLKIEEPEIISKCVNFFDRVCLS